MWKVGKMNAPPVKNAASMVIHAGPVTRCTISGFASMTEVISVSRLPSGASGR